MSQVTYAFVFTGANDDWRQSMADDWNIEVVELDGTESVLGHRKIDGAICKVIKSSDGKLVAITK